MRTAVFVFAGIVLLFIIGIASGLVDARYSLHYSASSANCVRTVTHTERTEVKTDNGNSVTQKSWTETHPCEK